MTDLKQSIKVMIMAGGTGGHVFPALATARELQKRGCHVEWLGTNQGIEAQIIPANNIPLHFIKIAGVRGKGVMSLISAPWKIVHAIWQAKKILQACHSQVVLGMGGYASGPGGLAAKLLGIPLVIHEQNARPGTTNKWLAKVANKVLTAFPNVFANANCVGNPVREDITQILPPNQRFARRSGPMNILVLGGSLGAKAINELIPKTLAQLPDARLFNVVHQTGKKHFEDTLALYQKNAVTAQVMPFIDDMAGMLAWADFVICRSGALTVSELSVAGVGSLLVPFPHAIDDHQTANANWLVEVGAAELRQQTELDVEVLKTMLVDLEKNRDKVLLMAEAARKVAHLNATQACAAACMEAIRG